MALSTAAPAAAAAASRTSATAPPRKSARPAPAPSASIGLPRYLQRRCACASCSTCGESEAAVLQRRAEPGAAAASAHTAVAAQGPPALGPGQALPTPVRQHLEPLFGRSLAPVRVHTGHQAAGATRALGAQAFTLGQHIAFAPGQFAPNTPAGLHLLAHEVAHTVQQGSAPAGPMRRPLVVGPPAGLHEQEADAAADRVLQGQPVPALTPVGAVRLQRRRAAAPPREGLAGVWDRTAEVAGALWNGASRAVHAGADAAAGLAHFAVDGAAAAGRRLWAGASGLLHGAIGLLGRAQEMLFGVVSRAYENVLAPLVRAVRSQAWLQALVGGFFAAVAGLQQAATQWVSGPCAQMGQSAQDFQHWLGEQMEGLLASAHLAWVYAGTQLTALWGQASTFLGGLFSKVAGPAQQAAQWLWAELAPVRGWAMQLGERAWQQLGAGLAWLLAGMQSLQERLLQAARERVGALLAAAQPLLAWTLVQASRLLAGLPPQLAQPLRTMVRRTAQRWMRLWWALRRGGVPGLVVQACNELLADLAAVRALVEVLADIVAHATEAVAQGVAHAAQALVGVLGAVARHAGQAVLALPGVSALLAVAVQAGAMALALARAVRAAARAAAAAAVHGVQGMAQRLRQWRAWAQSALHLLQTQLLQWWDELVWQRLLAFLAWSRATPCVRELLLVVRLDSLLATLGRIRHGVRQLVALARNPAPLLLALQRAVSQRLAQVPAWVARFQATLLFPGQPAHQAGVMRHLQPALENLQANGWDQLKDMGRTLLWPWPSVRQGLPELGRHGQNLVVALALLDLDTVADEYLATLQQLNMMLGALWGWFAIGATVIGGALGAIGAGPTLGASIWAGMGAGFALATEVGEVLLAVTIGTEMAIVAKGVADVLLLNPRIADARLRGPANEAAYERIAHSTFTLAVLDALAVLGTLVSEFVGAIWRGARSLVADAEAPVARGGTRRTTPVDISAADVEAASARLREVIDEPGRARVPRDGGPGGRYDLEVALEDGWTWRREAETGRWCLSINPSRCGIELDSLVARRAARARERAEAERARDAASGRIDEHDVRVARDSEAAGLLQSARQKLLRVADLDAPTPMDILTPDERALVNRLSPGGSAEGVPLRQTLRRLREAFEDTTDALETARGRGERERLERERYEAGRTLYEQLRGRSPNGAARRLVNERAGGVDELNGRPLPDNLASIDHVPPLNEVIDMPGFRGLPEWQQLEILNDPEFLMRAERGPNSGRGDRSFREVEPGNYLSEDQLAVARAREAANREAILLRIREVRARR